MTTKDSAQKSIHELYNLLKKRPNPSSELLDITDVLLQVYLKLEQAKNPEALVNRLVNYIYSVGMAGKLYFPPEEEALLRTLSTIGKKAGLNGIYRGNYSDKSQFYSYFDNNMPINH